MIGEDPRPWAFVSSPVLFGFRASPFLFWFLLVPFFRTTHDATIQPESNTHQTNCVLGNYYVIMYDIYSP